MAALGGRAVLLIAVSALLVAAIVLWATRAQPASTIVAGSGPTSAGTATTTHPLKLSAPNSIYFGASMKTSQGEAPWDMNVATTFEKHAGKGLSIISWGSPFYSAAYCHGYCPFTTAQFDATRAHGSIPMLSWGSFPGNGAFTDAQIAAGAQDAYLTQWAQAAKAWGHPLFLRFDWEMNGSWFPWGVGNRGTTPAQFIAMWRHVHDIFKHVGADNVSWVWCPNVNASTTYKPISAMYPGDAYVDWTCLDGYNGSNPWLTFGALYGPTYEQITGSIAPSKPMMLGEVASTEAGGSKAHWITNMFTVLPSLFPKVRGFVWFESTEPGPGNHVDWDIESSPSSQAAFVRGVGSPTYASNEYANLNASPIPPPH
jgi:hypothetical protein